MRFLFYSHDGLGLGHIRRNLAIATALIHADPAAKVLLATSVDEVCQLGLPANVDTLKLPGLRKVGNNQYAARRLGLPREEIHALRSALMLQAVRSFRPDLVLVDKHPFGVCGEFTEPLETAKDAGARLVLGLRDILDAGATVRREWNAERIPERLAEYFDQVLVYGVPSVFDSLKEYDLSVAVARRMHYCGYVVNDADCAWRHAECPYLLPARKCQRPTVLGTTGGGEDGFTLLKTFLCAAAGAPWDAIAVAGPMCPPDELKTLQLLARENHVTLHTFIPCLSGLFWTVDGVVCMGGYNTLVEAVSMGVPTVCVPRTTPRTEQLIRAQAFERLGLLRAVLPAQLSAESLRDAITASLTEQRDKLLERANAVLSFDGARQAASRLLALASESRLVASNQAAHITS